MVYHIHEVIWMDENFMKEMLAAVEKRNEDSKGSQ